MRPINLSALLRIGRRSALVILIGSLAGCAAQQYHSQGQKQISAGEVEKGLENLRQASISDPTNLQYRLDYVKQLSEETNKFIRRGKEVRVAGDAVAAQNAFRAALKLDGSNELARRGLADIEMDNRHGTMLVDAGKMIAEHKYDIARDRIGLVLADNPANTKAQALMRQLVKEQQLRQNAKDSLIASQSVLKKPVSLQFRDANIRMVFEALSRTTGLNAIFDRDVRADLKTTVFVRDGSVQDTVDLILLQNQLEKKILNSSTMLIYPATPAKQKEYLDLKVRTFRLSNGDAKYLQTVLKSVLKIKEVHVDERSNTLVLRDTPEALSVAAKLIAAHDVPDAEVMLEVEVLEVSRDRLSSLGIQWPENITVSTPAGVNGPLTIGALKRLNSDSLLVTPLQVGLNFKLQDTDANILASPRIRVRDREKAKILIGDKVPIITNTVTPVQTGSAVVTGSVQYIDVGIKLEVEPHVYAEGDVGIKLNLEVSNIVKEIAGPAGSLAYQIGTRSALTSLRLRDGETQVLGGLISDSDRNTAAKVPGLGQLPVLGRLFSNNNGDHTKSEVVLSITPHIVRAQGIADEGMREMWSGTESTVREEPLMLSPMESVGTGFMNVGAGNQAAPVMTMPAGAIQSADQPLSVRPETNATPREMPSPVPNVPDKGAKVTAVLAAPAGNDILAVKLPPADRAAVPAPASQLDADNSTAMAIPAAGANVAAAPPSHFGSSVPELAWGEMGAIKAGDRFSVTINASGFNGIRSVPLQLAYDPQVLTFVEARLGTFGTRAGASTAEPVVNQNTGRVNMTLNAGTSGEFTGSGELLNVTFTAKLARRQTQVLLAGVNLKDDTTVRAVPRLQPLNLKVDP